MSPSQRGVHAPDTTRLARESARSVRRASTVAHSARPTTVQQKPVAYEVLWNDETNAAVGNEDTDVWDAKREAMRQFAGSAREIISPEVHLSTHPSPALPSWLSDILETIDQRASRSEDLAHQCVQLLQQVYGLLEVQPPQELSEAFAMSARVCGTPSHLDATTLAKRISHSNHGGTSETYGDLIGKVAIHRIECETLSDSVPRLQAHVVQYKLQGVAVGLQKVPDELVAYARFVEDKTAEVGTLLFTAKHNSFTLKPPFSV